MSTPPLKFRTDDDVPENQRDDRIQFRLRFSNEAKSVKFAALHPLSFSHIWSSQYKKEDTRVQE
jgi:hypothetical protein